MLKDKDRSAHPKNSPHSFNKEFKTLSTSIDYPKPVRHVRFWAATSVVGEVLYGLATPGRWLTRQYRLNRYHLERRNAHVSVKDCAACAGLSTADFGFRRIQDFCPDHSELFYYQKI